MGLKINPGIYKCQNKSARAYGLWIGSIPYVGYWWFNTWGEAITFILRKLKWKNF